MSDIYLERMVADLAKAEEKLRSDIEYRGMSFSQQRLDNAQTNVDRLHELIRSYKATTPVSDMRLDDPNAATEADTSSEGSRLTSKGETQ